MGRRRRKIVKKKIIKPPPKIFLCPICNVEAVTVQRIKGEEYAEVSCSNCKAKARVRWYPAYSEVDAYSEFYDIVTGGKKVEVVEETTSQTEETTLEIKEQSIQESGDEASDEEPVEEAGEQD